MYICYTYLYLLRLNLSAKNSFRGLLAIVSSCRLKKITKSEDRLTFYTYIRIYGKYS